MPEIHDQGGRLLLIREYVSTMRQRSQALRGRALGSAPGDQIAAAEACQELETAHEELAVADEELRAQSLRSSNGSRQELAGEVRRFRDLFDHAPDGYVETDTRAVVRLANRTIAARLNIPPAFLERKPLINFVVRGDCDRFRAAILELQRGGSVTGMAIRLRPRRGKAPFLVDVQATPVTGLAQRVVAIRWGLRVVAPVDDPLPRAIASADALVSALVAQSNGTVLARRLRLAIEVNARRDVSPETASAWFPILSAAMKAELASAMPGSELRIAADDASEGIAWRVGAALLLLPLRAA